MSMTQEPFHLRTACRLCLSKNLVRVVEFPPAIPGEHLKPAPSDPDPIAIPIDFYQCQQCGHVQILHVPPLEELFNREYSFMPGNNPDLVAHFRKTIEYFTQTFTNQVRFAFELGSNDGVFLDELRKITGCRVLGMDPALPPAKEAEKRGVETLLEFFNREQAACVIEKYGHPDVVIANNVFAHNDDLRGMIQGIAELLPAGGYFLFEASWLKAVVEKQLIGTILHEHLSVHSLASLKPCLSAFGLQLIGAKLVDTIQGGVIIGVAQKSAPQETPEVVARIIAEEVAAGINHADGLKLFKIALDQNVARLQQTVQKQFGDQKLYGYGAARSAPFIIDVLGLSKQLAFIVDDNPAKKGKFMPVTNLPIVGSQAIDPHGQPPVFLILGWAQTARIIGKLSKIYSNGYAVTIFPRFEVVPLSEKEA